jgi:hypothetical protein
VEGEEGKASPPFVSQPYGSDVEGRISKDVSVSENARYASGAQPFSFGRP